MPPTMEARVYGNDYGHGHDYGNGHHHGHHHCHGSPLQDHQVESVAEREEHQAQVLQQGQPQQEAAPIKAKSRQTKKPSFWSKSEHEMFLEGLKRFGTEGGLGPGGAELISMFMGGKRTVLQVRSHAQKFFLKTKGAL